MPTSPISSEHAVGYGHYSLCIDEISLKKSGIDHQTCKLKLTTIIHSYALSLRNGPTPVKTTFRVWCFYSYMVHVMIGLHGEIFDLFSKSFNLFHF
jgi:hypothetical protein